MNDFKYALSHSRLSDFNQCALKFKLKYIDKAAEFKVEMDKSPHLVRGSNVHKALENYVVKINAGEENIRESSLPEVESTKPFIAKIYAAYSKVYPELQISVNQDWDVVTWFDKASYYRAIFDLIAMKPDAVFLGDYKTGKFTEYTPPNGYGQLELASAIALRAWPETEKVDTTYIYVDHKKTLTKSYTQTDAPRLVNHFIEEHQKVNAEENFDPKVNEYCKWCEATKNQCSYSRKMSTIALPK